MRACLFFDYDGANWAVVMDYFQEFSTSFTTGMVDPLQAMFDIYMQGFRGGLPHYIVLNAIGFPGVHKSLTLVFYTILVSTALYFVGRSAGFSKKISIFAPILFSIFTLPLFSDTGIFDTISALSPNFVYVIAIMLFSIAGIWYVDKNRISFSVSITILSSIALATVAISFSPFFVYLCYVAFFMGIAAIFSSKILGDKLFKIGAGAAIVILLSIAGIPVYIYDLASGMAYQTFYKEMTGYSVNNEGIFGFLEEWAALIFYYFFELKSNIPITTGILSAIIIISISSERKIIAFSLGYLVSCFVYYSFSVFSGHGFWHYVGVGEHYLGPVMYRLPHFLTPLAFILISYLFFSILSAMTKIAQSLLSGRRQEKTPNGTEHVANAARSANNRSCRAVVHLVLLASIAAPAYLAFSMNPGMSATQCPRQYFNPLAANAIVDYLAPRIALGLGKPFKGSVATFTGHVRQPAQPVWINDITTDWHIWHLTGNDLRTIGLWKYRIPTLAQASAAMTPQFFLTTTAFLSNPDDRQTRTFAGFTKPNEKLLSLWGVRYVIEDRQLKLGSQVLEMPFKPMDPDIAASPVRLYELAETNLGQYSPTKTVSAQTASEILAIMRQNSFDGRTTAVTVERFENPLVKADHGSISVDNGGFRLTAQSNGRSVLVLPVQFSHCWTAPVVPGLRLFRVNLMQLGVYFEGGGRCIDRIQVRSVLEFVLPQRGRAGCGTVENVGSARRNSQRRRHRVLTLQGFDILLTEWMRPRLPEIDCINILIRKAPECPLQRMSSWMTAL